MAAPRTIRVGEIEIEYVPAPYPNMGPYQSSGNYSAHITQLQGCVATGATEQEAFENALTALQRHVSPL